MDIVTLTKLNKLQVIRVRTQERLLTIDKKSYVDACDTLEKRNTTIQNIQNEKEALNVYISTSYVKESPTHRERVHIRRFWLEYDLEMHEYYHEQELNKKNEAEISYLQRKKLWNKEKQKSTLLTKKLSKFKILHTAVLENREDEISQEDSFKHGAFK